MDKFEIKPIPDAVYRRLPSWLNEIVSIVPKGLKQDMILLGTLTVASSTLFNTSIVYNGSRIYPSLYVFVIGGPGKGKGQFMLPVCLLDDILKIQENSYLREYAAYKESVKNGERDAREPKEQRLLIPMNVSSAALLEILQNNKEVGCMMESETDVLNRSASQDWGISSENLRKAFHHEPISSARLDNRITINEPRLSVGMTGTLNQYIKLIGNAEDGLFSRGLYYFIANERVKPDSVFSSQIPLSDKLVSSKGLLSFAFDQNRQKGFNYLMSERQKSMFQQFVDSRVEVSQDTMVNPPLDVIMRSLLQAIRISMVLDSLDQIYNDQGGEVYSSNKSLMVGIRLTQHLLPHALHFHSKLVTKKEAIDVSPMMEMMLGRMAILFTRRQFVGLHEKFQISQRTADNFLAELVKAKRIIRLTGGKYQKIAKPNEADENDQDLFPINLN